MTVPVGSKIQRGHGRGRIFAPHGTTTQRHRGTLLRRVPSLELLTGARDSCEPSEHAFAFSNTRTRLALLEHPHSPCVEHLRCPFMHQGRDGGYDTGYRSCPCFWGNEPGSLVAATYADVVLSGRRVLDLGCGEGKNATYLAHRGAIVDAVDCSALALRNARAVSKHDSVTWHLAEASAYVADCAPDTYEIVVMYGLLHCLTSLEAVEELVDLAKAITVPGGDHIACAFNDRQHDLSAHPGLQPLLLPHDRYLSLYSDWSVLHATDSDLYETHPHNQIPHHHSMTRLVVRKPNA